MSQSKVKANEIVLLESRLDQERTATRPEATQDEFFLLSSIDTVLRERELSYQQIEDGIVDGQDDGGIDAVYTFFNGRLLEDDTELGEAERPQIDLEVIQVKNENGFKELALQRLIDHLPLLLQLDEDQSLRNEFNERLLDRFQVFRRQLVASASQFPELSIWIRYITKSVESPNEKVNRKATRLLARIKHSVEFGHAGVDFVGAADLNTRARQRLTTVVPLKASESPVSAEKGGLICLVSLAEYYRFITDKGRLRERIFEENVRGYEGNTVINRAIAASLREGDDSPVDFWWLNNGVTVLGRRVQAHGKHIEIDDPQVVNGYQTSRTIYQHFHALPDDSIQGSARQLLVRVIEAKEEAIAAQVIKATNSQNRISQASLRAFEPFQRDIEEFFAKNGLYYERKKNHYKNQRKQRSQIVEVLELAQAVAAIALCAPDTARARPSSLVRDKLYKQVFKSKTPLAGYLNCIRIMQQVDSFLQDKHPEMGRQGRSNIRFHLARAASAFALSSSRPTMLRIAKCDPAAFDAPYLMLVLDWLIEARDAVKKSTGIMDDAVLAKGPEWTKDIDRRMSRYSNKSRWPKKLMRTW